MPARKRRGSGRTTPKGTKGPAKNGATNATTDGGAPTSGRPPTKQRSTARAVNQRPISRHRGNR